MGAHERAAETEFKSEAIRQRPARSEFKSEAIRQRFARSEFKSQAIRQTWDCSQAVFFFSSPVLHVLLTSAWLVCWSANICILPSGAGQYCWIPQQVLVYTCAVLLIYRSHMAFSSHFYDRAENSLNNTCTVTFQCVPLSRYPVGIRSFFVHGNPLVQYHSFRMSPESLKDGDGFCVFYRSTRN